MAGVPIGRVRPKSIIGKAWSSKWGRVGLTLLILNEIRGLFVVGAIVLSWLSR